MDIRRITDEFSVAPQIGVDDVAAIAAAGFRAVVCNRPDGEVADQPESGDIGRAVIASGMEWRMLPVRNIGRGDIDAFANLVGGLPKPVLAYCRSGTRCATLWSLTEIGRRSPEDIVALTRAAGYDMAPLIARAGPPRL